MYACAFLSLTFTPPADNADACSIRDVKYLYIFPHQKYACMYPSMHHSYECSSECILQFRIRHTFVALIDAPLSRSRFSSSWLRRIPLDICFIQVIRQILLGRPLIFIMLLLLLSNLLQRCVVKKENVFKMRRKFRLFHFSIHLSLRLQICLFSLLCFQKSDILHLWGKTFSSRMEFAASCIT